jgi:hypothetical protein
MNLRAIPLVHPPALSAFLRLHQVDLQLAKGDQVRSDDQLALELWLEFLEFVARLLFLDLGWVLKLCLHLLVIVGCE